MELTRFDLDGIRQDNLRGVSGEEFSAVWLAAEARGDELVAAGSPSDFVAGVQSACRWIANGFSRSAETGLLDNVASPITGRKSVAYAELIETEALAAEAEVKNPGDIGRAAYLAGVWATFAWSWRHSGVPPVRLTEHKAS
ncbi:hypothetical protein E1263_05165 [Kribbella antibiotica]|uniref:Uncharacterized protein n=1 Tax=Kribbella antibiotica TaxID=190195 RepID=A0A4R4ZSF6_9ACTN|nr:hypothetical protein [Kribbella antibiotica]TDD62008.1 hypothetical protein E1263_05165 [Kribbella antibiotica]